MGWYHSAVLFSNFVTWCLTWAMIFVLIIFMIVTLNRRLYRQFASIFFVIGLKLCYPMTTSFLSLIILDYWDGPAVSFIAKTDPQFLSLLLYCLLALSVDCNNSSFGNFAANDIVDYPIMLFMSIKFFLKPYTGNIWPLLVSCLLFSIIV